MQGSINFDGTLSGSIAGGGGGGGAVEDVTLAGESVVDANGVAVLPAYPTVPEDIVEDVTLGGNSVVSEGIAVLPAYPQVPEHIVTDVTIAGESVVNPETGVAEIVFPTPTNYVEDVEVNGQSVVSGHTAIIDTLFYLDGQEHLFGKISNNAYVYYKYITTGNIPANTWGSAYNAGYPILFIVGDIQTSNGIKWGLNYYSSGTFFNYYIDGTNIIVNWGGYSSNNTVANLLVFYVKSA